MRSGTPLPLHRDAPATVLVARDGRRIVTSVGNGPTVVRDARTLRPLRTLAIRATAIALSPDDRTLIAGARDGSVRFVDLIVGRRAGRHRRPRSAGVASAAFSRDGSTAATGGADNRVQVWDVAGAAAGESFAGHAAVVAASSPSARTPGRSFSAGFEGKVLMWDLAGDRRWPAVRDRAVRRRPRQLRNFGRG